MGRLYMTSDKYRNIKSFEDLRIPQTMDEVIKIANDFNIDILGYTISIILDPELLDVEKGYTGGAYENNEIDLYPLAFADTESLARTLFHETYHQKQYAQYGHDNVIQDYTKYEKITRNAEKSWWDNKEWLK